MAETITVKQAMENWIKRQWQIRKDEEHKKVEKEKMKGRDYEYQDPSEPVPAEETDVRLFAGGNGMLPPIAKMDKEIQMCKKCEILRLSSNSIEKIGPGLNTLANLRILSLGRNKIKKLENLDLPNLEELWISYNNIDKLSGLDKLKSLKVLYMSNNCIGAGKWNEIEKLQNNTELVDLLLLNNPIENNCEQEYGGSSGDIASEWRLQLLTRLGKLQKIDGQAVEPEERDEAQNRRSGM